MSKTSIQWSEYSWNPVRGCSRVSAGCDQCYAMGQAHRFSGPGKPFDGLTTIRNGKVDWSGRARFVPSMLDVPLRRKKPTTWFVNSMSDLFHESLSNEEIAAVFSVMAVCQQHTFQVLTKRPERMRKWFTWARDWHDGLNTTERFFDEKMRPKIEQIWVSRKIGEVWPLPNVWLGVSAEDQQRADERIPLLLETPAAVRWVSAEPLLGPIDFDLPRCETHDREHVDSTGTFCQECAADGWSGEMSYGNWLDPLNGGVDWVVTGGESGPKARPCALEWLESIVDQCREAHVPAFIKQLGACVVSEHRTAPLEVMKLLKGFDPSRPPNAPNGEYWAWGAGLKDKKGGDISEFPERLQVRMFPGDTWAVAAPIANNDEEAPFR